MKKLIVFVLIFISLAASCFGGSSIVKAAPSSSGTIRIMPDGHVEGTDKIQVSGNVYTLTDDIYGYLNDSFSELHGFMIILKAGIVIDGAGHTIQGNGTGVGIYLRGMQDVTIKNLNIKGFTVGINTYVLAPGDMFFAIPANTSVSPTRGTINDRFINNNIEVVNPKYKFETLGGWGIYVEFANDTLISGNTIKTQDPQKGIFVGSGFGDSTYVNTTLVGNNFVGCSLYLYHINEIFAINNTVDGKPLVFLRGMSNQVVDGAGQVFLYNCANISVRNVQPAANYLSTVQLEQTTNSEITNCGGTIFLTNSSNGNSIHENNATLIALIADSNHNAVFSNTLTKGSVIYARALSDYDYANTCIEIWGSTYNQIYNNKIEKSNNGIWLGDISWGNSHNNTIYSNSISHSDTGIYASSVYDNAIYKNNLTNCNTGISFTSSNQFTVYQNNIADCKTGISIWQSSSNNFYQNNFLNDQQPVYESHYTEMPPFHVESTNNYWYDSLAKLGNYWSDYNGTDVNGDGIGDTPYHVFENYQDLFPLMEPYGAETNAPTSPSPLPSPSPAPTSTPTIPPTPTPTPTPTLTSIPTHSPIPSPSPSPSSTSSESTNPLPSQNPTPKEQESTQNTELIYATAATAGIIVIVVIAAFMLRRKKQ